MEVPKFETKKELFAFLTKNKEILTAQKKAVTKYADGFAFNSDTSIFVSKAATSIPDELHVKAIINTTNVIDSHDDVHINGLWDKTLKENGNIMHLQEHEMKFTSIISDGRDLKAKTEIMPWKDLGFKFAGETQALVFNSLVKKSRNKYMHDQYVNGNVKNHSVGMRYVKLELAINDDEAEEFKIWERYIDEIANKKEAEDKGYFWAVTEAKIIEGSAVPIGSNQFTPTLETKSKPPGANKQHTNAFNKIVKDVLSNK